MISNVRREGAYAEFTLFGTYGYLAVRRSGDLGAALALIDRVARDIDETCSRFRQDSDLSRVNRDPGNWVTVDPLLVEGIRVAVSAAEATGGLVHPLLGRSLITLGYDRDFELLHGVPDSEATIPSPAAALYSWRRISLDHDRVRIPADTALDLGATAKAWAADLVAAGLEHDLGVAGIVSLGGDVCIAAADDQPWPIAIAETPSGLTKSTDVVWLDRGGLATSSTRVRRWRRQGVERHHLLDPRTGLPAREVWRSVTATGPSCLAANTATTASIVLGAQAPDWLGRGSVTARLVAADGQATLVGGWPTGSSKGAA